MKTSTSGKISTHDPTPSKKPLISWYFGWNIVIFSTILVLLTVGLRMAIGPFFFPISDDLGFSRSLLSALIAIAMLFYGLLMPFAGWIVERVGTKPTLLLGSALILIGTIWTINAHSALHFALGFGVILSIGLALVSPVTMTPIITRWFTKQRGMALFCLSTGGMAGLAVATPAVSWAIERVGWKYSLLGFSSLLVLIAVPGILLLMREEPSSKDLETNAVNTHEKAIDWHQVSDLRAIQALRTGAFWKVTIGLMANGFSMTLLGVHGVPMLIDHGFSSSTSAMGIGMIGFVAIAGTLVLGRMADKVSRKNMLALIYLVRGLAFIALLLVIAGWQLYAVAAIGGLVWAGAMALASAILADVYGIQILGVLYGIAYAFQQLAGLVSAWLGGFGYETWHTHWIAFGGSAIILFIGSITTFSLPKKHISYTRREPIK